MSQQQLHVYEAINAITAELSQVGIPKSRENKQQKFWFRGVDDVYAALAGLLSKHRLCIVPRVMSRECSVRQTQSGSALYSVTVQMEFDFVSSKDGSRHTAATVGEAMDTGDKASNKAMSAAFKYVCFQTFCIPTEGEGKDVEEQTPEETLAALPPETVVFQKKLASASEQGMAAYRKAWESGTPDQRKASIKLHEELKQMATIKDNMGAVA